jgi:hypothetical protein
MDNTGDTFDINRIISEGWKLYRRNLLSITVVVLLVSIPVNAALSLLPAYFITGHGPYDAWITRLLSAAKILVFNGLVAMAVSRIVESTQRGLTTGWSQSFRHALSRLGAALSLGALLALFAIGLLMLMLIPRLGEAVYYSLFMFYFFAVSLRDVSGMGAIDYTRELFAGRFGQVFWYQFVFFLFSAAFTAALLPMLLVFPRIPVVAIGFNAILDLFLAYPMVMSTLYFFDLEARRKGDGETVA